MNIIRTDNAPRAIGPYSQGIIANGFLFTAGQIPLDPKTMEMVEGGIEEQTKRVLKNLEAILKSAGADKKDVIKTTVFLKDLNDFQEMNKVYEVFFENYKPARSTLQTAKLPKDALVDIECIAHIP